MGAPLILHQSQALHIYSQVFNDAIPVTEDIVPSKERVLLFQDETHMVKCMTRGMDCSDRCTLRPKYLPVANGLLTGIWLIFENS